MYYCFLSSRHIHSISIKMVRGCANHVALLLDFQQKSDSKVALILR